MLTPPFGRVSAVALDAIFRGVKSMSCPSAVKELLVTRRSPADQAAWEDARNRVAAYHEQELAALINRLRSGLQQLDAGEIDVFELDDLVHHYKRSAQKLWSFCTGGGSDIRWAARMLELAETEDEAYDWWELGAPQRRR